MKGTIFATSHAEIEHGECTNTVHLCTNGRHVSFQVDGVSFAGIAVQARILLDSITVAPCNGACQPEGRDIKSLYERCRSRWNIGAERWDEPLSPDWETFVAEHKMNYGMTTPSRGRCFSSTREYRGGLYEEFCTGTCHISYFSGNGGSCYVPEIDFARCDHVGCKLLKIDIPAELLTVCTEKLSVLERRFGTDSWMLAK